MPPETFFSITLGNVLSIVSIIVGLWVVYVRGEAGRMRDHVDNSQRLTRIEADLRPMTEWFSEERTQLQVQLARLDERTASGTLSINAQLLLISQRLLALEVRSVRSRIGDRGDAAEGER